MSVKSISLLPLVALLLLAASPAHAAEKGTVQAAIPWEGNGRVFQVNTTTVQFLGALSGVMYIETAKGDMNEAFVQCPIVQLLDIESGATEATGHCEITISPESIVYARMTCNGRVGDCTGKFTLIDGEGDYVGITGEGGLRVRSPLHALANDQSSGEVVRVAAGLAIIKDLKYNVP
jgi:hypothetical protein